MNAGWGGPANPLPCRSRSRGSSPHPSWRTRRGGDGGGGWRDGYAALRAGVVYDARATAGGSLVCHPSPFRQRLPRSVPNMTRLRSRPLGDTGFIPIRSRSCPSSWQRYELLSFAIAAGSGTSDLVPLSPSRSSVCTRARRRFLSVDGATWGTRKLCSSHARGNIRY